MLQSSPPPGVCAWPVEGALNHLHAQIQGPEKSVYSKGIFKLEVRIPERYPFEPPKVRFLTPVYHPNIDSGGRICLDILNMPPKGGWTPRLEIPTVLASIVILLAEPNPDDGLMADITEQYINNRAAFDLTAQRWTLEHATAKGPTVTSRPSSPNLTKKALLVEEGKENLPHRENSPVPDDDVPLSPTRSSSSNGSGPSGLSASIQSFTPTGSRLTRVAIVNPPTAEIKSAFASTETPCIPSPQHKSAATPSQTSARHAADAATPPEASNLDEDAATCFPSLAVSSDVKCGISGVKDGDSDLKSAVSSIAPTAASVPISACAAAVASSSESPPAAALPKPRSRLQKRQRKL